MSREDKHFRLRMPESLKIWIMARAEEHRRSMTAEILFVLETAMKNEKAEARS